MFDNIGGKIKIIAKLGMGVGIITFCIIGIILMTMGEIMAFAGIMTAIIGSFISWAFSAFLYGFGQLVENSDILIYQSKLKTKNTKSGTGFTSVENKTGYKGNNSENPDIGDADYICLSCGMEGPFETEKCPNCGSTAKKFIY